MTERRYWLRASTERTDEGLYRIRLSLDGFEFTSDANFVAREAAEAAIEMLQEDAKRSMAREKVGVTHNKYARRGRPPRAAADPS